MTRFLYFLCLFLSFSRIVFFNNSALYYYLPYFFSSYIFYLIIKSHPLATVWWLPIIVSYYTINLPKSQIWYLTFYVNSSIIFLTHLNNLSEGGTHMRKLQCKYCNKYGGETGMVVHKEVYENCTLPGVSRVAKARVYTVKCLKCYHMWEYRKKIK